MEIEQQAFKDIDYTEKSLNNQEFLNCEFINCDFSKSDLGRNKFVDCRFIKCNFSLTTIGGTGFRDAIFSSCKIMGVDFSKCNKFMFSFTFEDCIIHYSSFYSMKLRKTNFTRCSLKEVDFENVDLTSSIFNTCDLEGSKFVRTILEKADFSTAQNFSIDPENNKIKKAKFSAFNLAGLLHKYDLDINGNI
jgi:fluoroquinolone resistance protein